MRNPFTATFGVSPPLLVGRDALLEEFSEGLNDGPGSSPRATLYTGARGTGKTVMLNAVEDLARQRGWLVISETATSGFVARMRGQHLPRLLRDFDPDAISRHFASVAGPLNIGGVGWETVERHVVEAGLRNQLELLTDLLRENETGVLITLDEIHYDQVDELRELATTIQHGFREGREIAFAGAGLASSVSDLANDEVLTFLRRAERHHLGPVSRSHVEQGFRTPIQVAGRSVADDALALMVEAAAGYPFLLQLVGAQTWRRSPETENITLDDARQGAKLARQRLARLVLEPALSDTTEAGRRFLRAMADDDGPSSMSDIAARLQVSSNYASQYRLRLIASELITPAGYGRVDFALPYLREFLRQQP